MNKIIKAMASIMIIILIVALIWIFISYYRNNEVIDTVIFSSGDQNVSALNIQSGEYLNEKNTINKESLIESIIKNSSGNSLEDIENNISVTSGDNSLTNNDIKDEDNNSSTEQSGNNEIPNTIIEIPSEAKNTEQFVISSDSQTSNQEKQEILTEIDEALKGLLEAVGKVEIVDEERLNATLDSEVDKQ